MFGDRNEKDDGRECQRREGEFGSRRECSKEANPTPLRNEAQLNCVSLRSELKYEVSWELSRVKMKAPFGVPLTAPNSPPEVYAARNRSYRKTPRIELPFVVTVSCPRRFRS